MFHGHLLKVRIHKKFIKAIYKAIEEDDRESYSTVSHYVRCAIIEKLRQDDILDKEGKF